MSAAPSPTSDPAETLRSILARLDGKEDYYALLGLPRTASEPEVQAAFVQWARVLHPDLPALRGELRADATRAFQMLTRARLTLTDPQRRAEYLTSIGELPQSAGSDVPNPALAKIHLHRARQLIQRRDWAQAEGALHIADELFGEPFDSECRSELAWSIFNNHSHPEHDRMSESRSLLDEVIAAQRDRTAIANAHYYLAVWHKIGGDMAKVKQHLASCVGINNKHVDAQRELRLFERRRSTTGMTPQPKAAPAAGGRESSPANRRASSAAVPAASQSGEARKVPLEKKQSLLERLFGGKR